MATYGTETLGIDLIPKAITGLTWQAQLASRIFDETGDKTVKSMWGEHNWNVSLINKLNKLYAKVLLPGADRVLSMTSSSGVNKEVVISFVKNIEDFRSKESTPSLLSLTGKLAENVTTGIGDIAAGAGGTAKKFPSVLVILSLGVAGYLIFAGRKGTKLTPF